MQYKPVIHIFVFVKYFCLVLLLEEYEPSLTYNEMILKYLKKWYVLVLLVMLAQPILESCSKHRRFKRMIKRRRSVMIKQKHRSPYQRQLKRKSVPINSNYVIKNKRNHRQRPWY